MKLNVFRHAVVQPLDSSYRYIPLTRGLNAIVDAEDFERLSQWTWTATSPKRQRRHFRTIYAARWDVTSVPKKQVFMHREIAKTPDFLITDHISGDSLDNRKANLRWCTEAENRLNTRVHRRILMSHEKHDPHEDPRKHPHKPAEPDPPIASPDGGPAIPPDPPQ